MVMLEYMQRAPMLILVPVRYAYVDRTLPPVDT